MSKIKKNNTLELEPPNLLRYFGWDYHGVARTFSSMNLDDESCLCKSSESPPFYTTPRTTTERGLNFCLATNLRHAQSRFPHPLGSRVKVDHILVSDSPRNCRDYKV